jgi:diguanylate cyclase (GGDEF)-like protein
MSNRPDTPGKALREAGLWSRFTAFLLGRGSARRVWWLTLAMVGAGLGISFFLVDFAATPDLPITLAWWVFALMVAIIEFPQIHLYIRSEAHSFTLGELGLCIGLFLVPPQHFIIGAVLGATIAKFRLPPLKLAFNAALWVLQASVAVVVFQQIANLADPFGGWGVAATFASMTVVGVIGVVAVFAAITLVQGKLRAGPLAHAATIAAPVTIANTGLGLIAAYLFTQAPQLVIALLGPVAVLFLAYRAFIVEHQQHERLQVVYRATRSILEAPELSLAITSLLSQAREVFRADIAQIVLYPEREDEPILVSTAGPGDHLAAVRSVASLDGSVFAGVALTRRSERLDMKDMAYRGGMIGVEQAIVRDTIVAPLEGERRIVGAIAVANRFGETAFDASDLLLLETLAGHAGVAIGNGRLERTLDELKELQSELAQRATHDALTGLANSAHFAACLQDALDEASGADVGLIYVDLDDFKSVNDRFGHAAGDRTLQELGTRLRSSLRTHDVAGRLGGDEFAVLLQGVTDVEQLSRLADRIRASLERPIAWGDGALEPRVSLGITLATGETTAEALLSDGDTAMYHAKRAGKGRAAVYDAAMRDESDSQAALIRGIAAAVESGELVLHYQPIVSIADRRVVDVEALVRWDRPGWGLMPPSAFIPLAEEVGLSSQIGRWVMKEASGRVAGWNAAGLGGGRLGLSVNVSPAQLADPEFAEMVQRTVTASGLPLDSVTLEITERVLTDDSDLEHAHLVALRARGVKVAIDDFGTGVSSLAELGTYPVDVLKIPGAFVASEEWGDRPGFADALVTIGRTLDIPTVAETIETAGQVRRLERLGCEFGQGHAFAPAMSAEEFVTWMRAGGVRPPSEPPRLHLAG